MHHPGASLVPKYHEDEVCIQLTTVVVAIQPQHLTDHYRLVRYCLRYKRIPFTTAWVELPDIAGLLQSKGITHPPYTLPAIEDPNTGAFIMDSLAIATYLDETYPETPEVLSPAARTVLEGVWDVFSFGSGGGRAGVGPNANTNPGSGSDALGDGGDLAPRLVFLILAAERLNPVSKAYYHETRAARLGERWTTLRVACSASPEERAEKVGQGIEAIRGVWRKVTALYDREGDSGGGAFALGKEPSLLDFAVAGRIKFILDGLNPAEAGTLTNLEGGSRLGRLVESLEKYYKY
jgi:glutathione S-transferase